MIGSHKHFGIPKAKRAGGACEIIYPCILILNQKYFADARLRTRFLDTALAGRRRINHSKPTAQCIAELQLVAALRFPHMFGDCATSEPRARRPRFIAG